MAQSMSRRQHDKASMGKKEKGMWGFNIVTLLVKVYLMHSLAKEIFLLQDCTHVYMRTI